MSMSEVTDAAAVSQSEPIKQAEVRGGSSRSVRIVAFEEWRTDTAGSQPVAKEHTRKKEEPLMGNTATTPRVADVSTKQQRIAKLAEQMSGKALTSLSHHIDGAWLLEAWRRTRQDGAKGVDGQSAEQYAENLHGNLADLLDRAKSGRYKAPPVKRVHIPKGDGKSTRPIGIPTLEDKVLQRAIVMALEPIYEADFKSCSYGFRPGKSAHDALEALWQQSMGTTWRERPVQWVLDVDIKSYFDTLDHTHLRQMLDKRIRDGVIRRLIDKWLKAGVMEQGKLSYQAAGTPQGGVISPLLSNIYLHEVLDEWFEREVQPRMRGRVFLVRYADDFVIGFEHEEDARRVQAVLPKRFERFGLKLHPEKTRLVEFKPPPVRNRKQKEDNDDDQQPPHGPERTVRKFDFLGFTHYWSHTRKGKPIVKRRTASTRLTRALKALRDWMRHHRHDPVREQWRILMSKMRGHAAYYGIPGNSQGISSFSYQAQREWFKWLNRRGGQKSLNWGKYGQWLKGIFHWPAPRVRS